MSGPASSPSRNLRRWLPVIAFSAAAVALALVFAVPRLIAVNQNAAAIGGPFALTDQHGKPVTDADFRGKVMAIYFGYTYCPDVCPTTLATIGRGLDALKPEEREQIVPIFVTVDPERDTPEAIGSYVANFAPDMVALTGSLDAIAKVEHEYRVYAKKHPEADGSYSMDHSSIIYLMGRDGRYRGILSGEVTAQQVTDALRKQL